jgi:phosphatidylserine/phosphatidylglycerophosphate/cardiolipin synthase-like enzyme
MFNGQFARFSMKSSRQFIWLLAVAVVAAGFWAMERTERRPEPVLQRAAASAQVVSENHFSPDENLERLDAAQLGAAQRSLDIAMYAFTDKYLAEAIVQAARRGVQVRIYRDHAQFLDEQRKAGRHEDESTTEMFRGERNIQVRVKHKRELMHLKAYAVDGTLLRDGSANWSPSGLKRQDNNARFTTNPVEVQAFQKVFEDMWAGRENEVLQ